MKKYYEKREKTFLADLSDIDSRMAELDELLIPSGEGGGLSADVIQEESEESLPVLADAESDTEE